MPDDWNWTPDETGMDDDEFPPLDWRMDEDGLDPLLAREYGLWDVYDPAPCPFCGEQACERSCTNAILAAQADVFPRVQAQAQTLYAAYVAGLGPLGMALPPWQDLIERQQYAWRCVVRAGIELL